jgi:hypothetical protein
MLQLIGIPGKLIIAAVSASLRATGRLAALTPAPASAAIHQCLIRILPLPQRRREWWLYHYVGSDRDLHNNRYEGGDTAETVANTARNAWNSGRPGPKDDVIVYGRRGWDPKGGDTCIRLNTGGPLPRSWWNSIESYRWATNAECEAAGVTSF